MMVPDVPPSPQLRRKSSRATAALKWVSLLAVLCGFVGFVGMVVELTAASPDTLRILHRCALLKWTVIFMGVIVSLGGVAWVLSLADRSVEVIRREYFDRVPYLRSKCLL